MELEQTASGLPVPVRRGPEEWRSPVRESGAGGGTMRAWCEGRGFSPKTPADRRSRFRGGGAPAFVAVAESGRPAALEVGPGPGGGAVFRLRRA
ncbi:MAG: hypothetical protein OXF74_06045 [Rhodobacteraceae bacterium]|nr:hypothetical protein [Paracoccaceae bacterium]